MTTSYGGLPAYSAHRSSPVDGKRRAGVVLVWAVLVCGLATYLVSLFSSCGFEWAVRFSAFAAVVAAIGLLPDRRAHLPLMAGLATVGFAEAFAESTYPEFWVAVVILVLNGAQTLLAVAALLTDSGALRDREGDQAAYDPYAYYAYYAQAAQQSYAQHREAPDAVAQAGSAQAEAAGSAQAHEAAAQRYAQYAAYWAADAHVVASRPTGAAHESEPNAAVAATGHPGSGPPPRRAAGAITQPSVEPSAGPGGWSN